MALDKKVSKSYEPETSEVEDSCALANIKTTEQIIKSTKFFSEKVREFLINDKFKIWTGGNGFSKKILPLRNTKFVQMQIDINNKEIILETILKNWSREKFTYPITCTKDVVEDDDFAQAYQKMIDKIEFYF